jgi:RNA polymerase sigma-70 factor (ECF subfamily)
LNEKELIKRILLGEEGAKTLFYESHARRLKPICVHFLGYQDSDIDDIVQQTFVIAFQKLPEFEPRSTLYTWLAHICVNLCFERIRKRKRVLVSLEEDLEHLTQALSRSTEDRKESEKESARKLRLLEGLMLKMSAKCRQVLELRDWQGKSYAEVGKALKVPIGTVMSQLARCREALKQLAQNAMGES